MGFDLMTGQGPDRGSLVGSGGRIVGVGVEGL